MQAYRSLVVALLDWK